MLRDTSSSQKIYLKDISFLISLSFSYNDLRAFTSLQQIARVYHRQHLPEYFADHNVVVEPSQFFH